MTEHKVVSPHKRKGSIFRTIKAVMWSFVGLRARGDYEQDAEFRGRVQAWLAQLWSAKDEQIDALLAAAPPRDATGSPPAG